MAILLFITGALAVGIGILMAGYGIPVSEFSFGNTLIVAGSTVAIGGLIVIGLGAVVSRLQQVIDLLGSQFLDRSARPVEGQKLGAPVTAVPGQGPFQSALKSEPMARVPRSPETPVTSIATATLSVTDPIVQPVVATLPNPDRPPMVKADTVLQDTRALRTASLSGERQRDYSNSTATNKPGVEENKIDVKPDLSASRPMDTGIASSASEGDAQPEILKSGVVDGMGYTLYVDGSIEAELPQGTLRFTSIDELRDHLEKNA